MVKAELGIKAQGFRENRPSSQVHNNFFLSIDQVQEKMLDGHTRFAYVGGCRALVAQLDRATGYEPVGREFESLRAHHIAIWKACLNGKPFFFSHHKKCEKNA